MVHYGFVFPGGTAPQQLELAELAERSGWDAVFVWEAAVGLDAWSLLSAMAVRTERIRLGTLLTPLPWRRPWKVAAQLATLDQLSNGRAILSVGLGAVDAMLAQTGEETDRRRRAELLDEALDIIDAVFEEQTHYAGRHYQLDVPNLDLLAASRPVQLPRPPIWVVGAWPREASLRRVLRGDGLLPNVMDTDGPRNPTVEEVAAMRAWLDERAERGRHYELICEGETPHDDPAAAAAEVAPWAAAGATWWIESRWGEDQHSPQRLAEVRRRLEAGPPRP